MKISHKLLASASLIISTATSPSFADGYSSSVYSTTGIATSYAGSVTGQHDASDMFFNPSVISNLDNGEFIASITHLDLNFKATQAQGPTAPYTNTNLGNSDSGIDSQVPAFYLAKKINDKTTFGLSLTAPFAVATKYDRQWAGRYGNVESDIRTINLNPSIAFKASDKLSIGAGIQAQHNRAVLTKMANLAPGVNPDIFAKTEGSDMGYGYNLGASYNFTDYLKFGIGYRSKIDYKLKGNTNVSGILTSDFTSKLTTPESLTIGLSYKFNPKLDLAYDMSWTRWSRFKEMSVKHNQNTALLDDTVKFDYNDSFIYSIGGNYKVNKLSTIRFGGAYEKSGIPDITREPRIPLGNRYWLSAGYSYKASDSLFIDLAYAHQFHNIVKSQLDDVKPTKDISAKYKNRVDVYSLAIRKEF